MADNLYDLLGVSKDADPDAIRKAYRKLARQYHPDVNPGDATAEEKFKKVSSAYDVLSDEKKKKAYDEFGDAALHGNFDAEQARAHQQWQQTRGRQRAQGFDQGPVDFDFADLFGRAQRGPRRGQDLHASLELELRQAIEGTEIGLDIPGQGQVRVRIPPGADDGSRIRIAGKGSPGAGGGPAGDLIIETSVKPHPRLRRDELDLYLTVPVNLDEAYNGGSIEVPTFDGPVILKVPPRSQSGTKLRLRGKGVARKDRRGDFFVELDVRLPDQADDALAAAAKAATEKYTKPVREGLTL